MDTFVSHCALWVHLGPDTVWGLMWVSTVHGYCSESWCCMGTVMSQITVGVAVSYQN